MREAVWIATFPFIIAFRISVGAWTVGTWIWDLVQRWRREPPFGNARWATVGDLRRAGNLSGNGFVVGRLKGHLVRTRGEHSCLMFGRPGSGKSLTMGATLHAASGETLVVYDPPGALLERFQGRLEARGYTVRKIDLNRPLDGLRYDVCAVLDDASPYEFESRLKQLADLATADLHDGGKNSEHFAETARILIQGILSWLHQNERPNATLYTVAQILLASSSAKRASIFKQIAKGGGDRSLMAINMWEAAEAAQGGEASGFRSSVTRALEPWSTRAYRDLTTWNGDEATRFNWPAIFDDPTPQAVFLTGGVLKAREVQSFVRVFFGQAAATVAARFAEGHPNRPTRLMIDEGIVLGRCEPVLSAIEEMRKTGVTVFIGYQSLAQLRSIWDKQATTLLDCCDLIITGGGKSPKDYHDISQLIGQRTVKTVSKGRGGRSVNEVGRPLWGIEDGFAMGAGSALVLLGGHALVLSRPYSVAGATLTYH